MLKRHGKSACGTKARTRMSNALRGKIEPTPSSCKDSPVPLARGAASVPGSATVILAAGTAKSAVSVLAVAALVTMTCCANASAAVSSARNSDLPLRAQSSLQTERMVHECNDRLRDAAQHAIRHGPVGEAIDQQDRIEGLTR